MTNNHLELVGIGDRLEELLKAYKHEIRDGSVRRAAEILTAIENEAEDDGFLINKVIFRR